MRRVTEIGICGAAPGGTHPARLSENTMRLLVIASLIAMGAACSGGEPAPAPAPAPEAPPAPPAPVVAPAAAPVDLSTLDDAGKLAALQKIGEAVYNNGGNGGIACTTCHQPTGEGTPPAFPPLKGQKDWMGTCVHHAGLVVHGLTGEIEVGGVKYNGVMPAQGNLSDLEIAAVITYVRTAWGNDFGPCFPEDVAKARTEPAPKGK
jgi:mono/diheme cytochrome c family protein